MKVVKASAGSGKTYTLANHYIGLLMNSEDRYAYRHILAVTFTNKATAEMKARILRDLEKLADTEPKARRILVDILHDYSAFSISTIDRFFQQTLKAFSREIGQFAAYQVELDKQSLVEEAMDRVLDGITPEDRELIDWLMQSVMVKVEAGSKFKLDESLYEIGRKLKSAEYRKLASKLGINDDEHWSKQRLETIRSRCRTVIRTFRDGAERFGYTEKPGIMMKAPKARERKASPELAAYFDDGYADYCTATVIDRMVHNLGLASEFYREYEKLLEEKNVMPLDDSNDILRKIIDGSDAPFIYEKTGVRFEHFLLDEFQDTSAVQWDNFLPLLKESESRGGKSLIVGDVKQSIYRWRDSDWRLLGEQVLKDFPHAETFPLDSNWRSCSTIVGFNGNFFEYAARRIGADGIYSDVRQKVRIEDPQPGSVRISFTGDQMEAIRKSISGARERGAGWGDIAVLVRGHKEGGSIAEALIADGIPVISDDSLALKSSVVVRRLVSLLSVMNDPDNAIGGFLASSFNIDIPKSHHSLTDLCENLLRQLRDFDPAPFEGETLFIQAFMDNIQNWVDINGNNLRNFLRHWEESDPVIGSPQNSSSVRIITIHKSKGLEFPFVIFPFAEKVGGYKPESRWCCLDASGSLLGEELDGIYPVDLSSASADTLFREEYEEERRMQAIDSLNIFYVALTRAEKGLHIIAAEPSKKCRESLKKGKDLCEFGNMSELLYAWGNGLDENLLGVEYNFTCNNSGSEEGNFPASYPSFSMHGRMKASAEALEFFGEEGVGESARLCGIRMHAILSAVDSADQLPDDMDAGEKAMLSERINAHPEWFGKQDGTTGRNEVTVFAPDGSEHRPDRVVIKDGRVTVIDYKFGEHRDTHIKQVRSYMELYSRMGWADVRGFVWYVRDDESIMVVPDNNLLSL